jgi:hypothetical protein
MPPIRSEMGIKIGGMVLNGPEIERQQFKRRPPRGFREAA